MDVTQIEDKITSRTKAIMVVHIYGLPVDMNPVLKICSYYGLKLIEDSAEAIGQDYRGIPCGSFGDVSTFSFYPNKHITTGEGGMILTDDDELAETCRSLRNLCFQANKRFLHERLGWNLRMTNLQAAVGLAQLEKLDEFLEKKRSMGLLYQELLKNVNGVQLPLEATCYAENHYWVFGIILSEEYGNADLMMEKLAAEGVGTRPFFYPLHQQPVIQNKYQFAQNQSFLNAEKLATFGLYLPSGLKLSDEDIKSVCEKITQILNSKMLRVAVIFDVPKKMVEVMCRH